VQYTLQPTLRLGRDVWDRTAMPAEEFHDRAKRLRGAMGTAGLDALLLYGSGLNECGHPTYLSNYVVKLPFAALVVLPREGEPTLMFQGATRGRAAAQATTWIEDVRPCWDIAGVCLEVLADRGLMRGRIGLAGMPRLVPFADWRTLVAGLDRATLVDAESLVDGHRAIKSVREIGHVRAASRIVDHAMGGLRSIPIADEASLAARVMRDARLHGAEDVRLLIGRPQEVEWAFRPPEEARIHHGDTVFVYLGASWERYWAETTRTFRAAPAGLAVVSNEELDERFSRCVDAAAPGVDVASYARAVLGAYSPSEAGILERCGLGHGIGVTPAEAPMLSAANHSTFARGMCLAIRAAATDREGPVLRSDTVLI